MLPVFPYSPMPGGITRTAFWNENNLKYDSGVQQGFTNFAKPLIQYTIPLSIYNEIKQSSVWPFFRDTTRGMAKPFLIKDPYDQWVQPVTVVRSGFTHAATVAFCDTNSYSVRVDTLFIGSLSSVLSGYVRLGVEYNYSVDDGILTVNTKASGDVWTNGQTVSYYKKVKLQSGFTEAAAIWNIFGASLTMSELP
jgi:hypothetical protein